MNIREDPFEAPKVYCESQQSQLGWLLWLSNGHRCSPSAGDGWCPIVFGELARG